MRGGDGGLPGGLVTFLFTDVEGSTRLHERLGDAWEPISARHDALLGGIVAEHGGAVVKWMGDGMFAAFGDAAAGVAAAAAILDAVAAEPWGVELRVRAGLHTGPAQPKDGDYTALAVHVAARVCSAAHGGQVLASADVPGTEAWIDLGAYVLAGLAEPVHLRAPVEGPRPRAKPAVKHNVPALRTSFVGRETELAELAALVEAHRVVSVLGPGGTGKTRLAFELARRQADAHTDGAWVVQLADLPAGTDVAERVAATLGVRPAPGVALLQALAEWCAAHDALVVLDNCEHVAASAAAVADAVLGHDAGVRFLVTSREPLRIAGEVSWRLRALPDTPEAAPADAVALFLDRARLARPELDLTGHLHEVAELCRQVDGLPLAIELAAARLRTMSLEGLLAKVRDRLGLLRGRTHGVDDRHQSLRALVDFSHDLLPDDERLTLRRCAAFRSTFSTTAAAAVCDLDDFDAEDVLERLADRSLLQVTPGVEPRFRMLLTIRDYALDRLRDAGEDADTARRHAGWVTATVVPVAGSGEAFESGDPAAMLAVFGDLHDDAVAALEHLAGTGDDGPLADLANAMFWYWLAIGAYGTGLSWLRLAGERGNARALSRAGTFANAVERGDPVAGQYLERAVTMARTAGEERVLAECLVRLAAFLSDTSAAEAEEACLEALRLDTAPRDRGGALLLLGNLASGRGDIDTTLARYEEALAAGGGPSQAAIAQGNTADLLLDRGDLAGASERLLWALPVLEDRQRSAVPWLCRLLYRLAVAEGDAVLAGQWLDRGLRVAESLGAATEAQRLRDLKVALAHSVG